VGNEALHPQLLIDLPERRLSVVEIDELHFGLNDDGVVELFAAVLEDREFAPLDVDLEEIDAIELGDVIEAPRLEPRAFDDMSVCFPPSPTA
jgi:hypothetical protein